MHLGGMVRSWALCHPAAALSLGHCGPFPRATSPRPPLLKHGQDGPEPPDAAWPGEAQLSASCLRTG